MPSWRVSILFGTIAAVVMSAAVARLTLAQDMPPGGQQQQVAPAAPAPTAATPPPSASAAPAPATPAPRQLSQAQLDQIVAPVALYPDPLLSQMLMAATYPLEVVEAARWINVPANKALAGDALTNALKQQNWDPSVMALAPFPRVLQEMSSQLSWTEQLGNAFLAQQSDVMAAVQRLRHQAMAAGNLKQTPECRCTLQTSGDIVSILPAEQQVVSVPVYNPRVVYGSSWPEPAYPPIVLPVPAGFAYAPGFWIGFEPPIELAVFGPLWGWGSFDWAGGRIAVDTAAYSRIASNGAAFAGGTWVHDPAHRAGVAYADPAVTARFGATAAAATRGAPAAAAGPFGAAATASGRLGAAATGARFGAAATSGRFGTAATRGPFSAAATGGRPGAGAFAGPRHVSGPGLAPHAFSAGRAPAAFRAGPSAGGPVHAAHFAPAGGAPHGGGFPRGPAAGPGGGPHAGGAGHHH